MPPRTRPSSYGDWSPELQVLCTRAEIAIEESRVLCETSRQRREHALKLHETTRESFLKFEAEICPPRVY